jgi:hypothetical protein
VAEPYLGLAADYDWIFDDGALTGGGAINRPATARLLQRIGPGGGVLGLRYRARRGGARPPGLQRAGVTP